jgi:predicted glycogen debranching enzyme
MSDFPSILIDFGREICGELDAAEKREWLVTNGLGGFASGTVAGSLTRRYHGLLVAALKPPLGRTLLVAKVDEIAQYGGETFLLGTNRWASDAVDPEGFRLLERFRLEGMIPVWTFAFREILLEKRVWMERESNTTYLRYDLARGTGPVELAVKILVNYRDYHAATHAGNWQMQVEEVPHGVRITAFPSATPIYLLSPSSQAQPAHNWYLGFELSVERARGLDPTEDHLHAATFRTRVTPDEPLTIVLSTEPDARLDGRQALTRRRDSEQNTLQQFSRAQPQIATLAPPWIFQLVLAADQFIVRRKLPDDPDARSVIAGYHWFGDWGRDTMVSLPGLTLSTGRPEVARKILAAFSRFMDGGMLPNCFPDSGNLPQYNTVDAALWYIEAARQYLEFTHDADFLRLLYPTLLNIVRSYSKGTHYNIHVDPADGLLYAGKEGVQLTWMDAKVGDWVVTPRIGKPIEVNALWLNALAAMAQFARALGEPSDSHEKAREHARQGFARYWNARLGYCFDVLDGPGGNDASFRPNQIFAVSLRETALTHEQQRAVVDLCASHLLTSFGLRSLAPSSADYRGRYAGGPAERDAAYHQGTVWGWLLAHFALAHWRVYQDRQAALSFLEPMRHHLQTAGLGTASEIFDGDPPFEPSGAIAQAWTVGEVLRAWSAIAAA